jgi:hypothetical protein
MKHIYVFVLLVFMFSSLFHQYYKLDKEITLLTSNIDGKEYFVLRKNDSQKSVDQLGIINKNIKQLFNNCSKDESKKKDIQRMIYKYTPDDLSELSPNSKYTAYSLNKGEKLKICLRDKNMKLINDMNTTMYIMCHELSHLMTKEEQHPPIFWDNMVYLLKKATNCGIYKPIDYLKNPVKYGDNLINHNPLFTENETDIKKKYPYIN